MLPIDFLEPFAMLESCVPMFISSILSNEIQQSRFSSFFDGTTKKPDPFCITEGGETIKIDAISQGNGTNRKMVAVVPLWGALSPNGEYGGTATRDFAKTVASLANDSQIGAIVIRVNSPGGTVVGTMEAQKALLDVRQNSSAPIVASVDHLMASAATWLGTTASEVWMTPSGSAGSIGVISIYSDVSQALEKFGIKLEVMRAPAKKARFSGVEPMTEDMRATMTTRLGEAYADFKRAMADNRKVRIDSIESRFGGGELLNAEESLAAGLVDKIGTFDDLVSSLLSKMKTRPPASNGQALRRAELDILEFQFRAKN